MTKLKYFVVAISMAVPLAIGDWGLRDPAVEIAQPANKRQDAPAVKTAIELQVDSPLGNLAVFSQDGKVLASTFVDQSVGLWDVATGRLRLRLEKTPKKAVVMAFSPDGSMLASSHEDKTMVLWSLVTGKNFGKLEGHKREVVCIAFSPDGKTLATGSADFTLKFWDTATCKNTATFDQCGNGPSHSCAFSPDGKTFAASTPWGEIGLIEVATRQTRAILHGNTAARPLAFSPDGSVLASGWNSVLLWDLSERRMTSVLAGEEFSATRNTDYLKQILFTPDGKMLVGLPTDGKVRLWHMPSATRIAGGMDLSQGVFASAVSVTPGGELVVYSRNAGSFFRWRNPLTALAAEARRLTPDLAHASVQTRAAGAARLVEVGEVALDPLGEAVKGADTQLGTAAAAIVERITAARNQATLLTGKPTTLGGMQFTLKTPRWLVPSPGKGRSAVFYLELKNVSDMPLRMHPHTITTLRLRHDSGHEFGEIGEAFEAVPVPISAILKKGESMVLAINGNLVSSEGGLVGRWFAPPALQQTICYGLPKGVYDAEVVCENRKGASDGGPEFWIGRARIVFKGVQLK